MAPTLDVDENTDTRSADSRSEVEPSRPPGARGPDRRVLATPPSVSKEPGDAELVRRTRRGDAGAFNCLVRRYLRPAVGVAWEFAESLDEAEDIVQDAFFRVLENLDSFDSRRPFSPWFYTIVRNLGRNQAARRGRWSQVPIPEALAAAMDSPAEDADRNQLGERLADGIDDLPPMQRSCFQLCELEGFSSPEVAEMLDISPATVRVHVGRARAALRKALRPYWEERKAP